MKKLPRSFYTRPTLRVAQDLLGKILVRKSGKHILSGRIFEVEAYLGAKDPASHTYRGKTKRNEVMYRQGGHLYVYFTYGMHFCANVVTGKEGVGEAVLIRAVEPLEGIETMKKNRGLTADKGDEREKREKTNKGDERELTNGPAKLCQAFGIGREQNGTDLLGDEIYLIKGKPIPKSDIVTSTRIGITSGKEKKWRFFFKGNEWTSKK
jgi:DNA-3-methyladenine glycosylase